MNNPPSLLTLQGLEINRMHSQIASPDSDTSANTWNHSTDEDIPNDGLLQENLLNPSKNSASRRQSRRTTSSQAETVRPIVSRKVSAAHAEPAKTSTVPPPSRFHQSQRLVIAIDYGTTFTGVAFATTDGTKAGSEDVYVVREYGHKMTNEDKVPSVISYSRTTSAGEQQWGHSLSPGAVTMINTKLELDVQDNKLDELEALIQFLKGTRNLSFDYIKAAQGHAEYTSRKPEEIVQDYLAKIFPYVDQAISERLAHLRTKMPVDIVITVPVRWSYRAKNSTLRAIRNAGFNKENYTGLGQYIMVHEPEAAAIYASRYLKETKGQDFLKVGDCFVLCDAGGGTVDVASYKITQLLPSLEFEAITLPAGAKCGSSFIDANFKHWLFEVLGEGYYEMLTTANPSPSQNTSEGESMRAIMTKFDMFKRRFSKRSRDMKIELPEPLGNLTMGPQVKEGALIITNQDMTQFFDPCINRTIEEIQNQIAQVEKKSKRVKSILLVGGFGESVYLQEELEFSLRLRQISLRRPDTSWSAVVRGAVLYGIQKFNYKNVRTMKTSPRSYGVMLNQQHAAYRRYHRARSASHFDSGTIENGQLTWLIRKHDLLLSHEPVEVKREFPWHFDPNAGRIVLLPVYEYSDDDVPERFENSAEELTEITVLKCDLSNIPIEEFIRKRSPETGTYYHTAYLVCRMLIEHDTLAVEIRWNDRVMAGHRIRDIRRPTVRPMQARN